MKIEIKVPEKKEESEQDRKDYCAAIFAVFPRLEKDIKEKMYEQLVSTYSEGIATSRTKEDRDFEIVRGNGIMEGMATLLEYWKIANEEHIGNSSKSEDFDEHSPLSEV